MKKTVIISLTAIALITSPYIWVETLTKLYGNQFYDVSRIGMSKKNIEYLKVFSYYQNNANVFIVDDNSNIKSGCRAGSFYKFEKTPNKNIWVLSSWGGGWSECGSADAWTFPPYL